jgi:hypothetical protein
MPPGSGGGFVEFWGNGLSDMLGNLNSGQMIIPPTGGSGTSYSKGRPSGMDAMLFNELLNSANRLGCAVGEYIPDYLIQEW